MKMPKLLRRVLRNVASHPSTIQYPREKASIEQDFRGLQYADLTKCTGCSLCAIECPADAITMTPIPQEFEVPRTNPRRLYPRINYGKCVFCYRCVKVCPVAAYVVTNKFDLAGASRLFSDEFSLATAKRLRP